MPKTQTTHIIGPAGELELQLTQPDAETQGTAILCHPHPLYGGSMHDRVLGVCAQTLLQLGMSVARFNFRGVGASAGISGRASEAERQLPAYNPPEVGDLYAVIDEFAANPTATIPLLVGYSFGAHVLWHALVDLTDDNRRPDKAIFVAPPTSAMTFRDLGPSGDVDLHGIWCSGDDYVDPSWFASQPSVATHLIQGGDHFFSNQHHALSSKLIDILASEAD
jgi:alpha/beta superfamily hydrolase